MKKNIVLIGFMGTGKTTIAKMLSKFLNMPMVDTDEQIELDFDMSIKDIFAKYGEKTFRDMETSTVEKLSAVGGQIISTGGGVVLRDGNIGILKENGIVVCLKASSDTILNRIGHNNDRPLLQSKDRLERIKELLAQREQAYSRADFSVITDDKSKNEIVKEIVSLLESTTARSDL